MTLAFPALFLSHGAPNLVLHQTPAHKFLRAYGEALSARHGKPKAIVLMSAHFEADVPSVSADAKPTMIYDFGGFEPELYSWVYPAPGEPELAARVCALLEAAGVKAQAVHGRGFDHGTWVPLSLLFPQAGIPVVQLSVQTGLGAAHHVALGRALAPLRAEGVLVIGSGSYTHNLQAYFRGGYKEDAPVPPWVAEFGAWVEDKIRQGDVEAIAAYRARAPMARENHPTEEHFLPLPFAMGAGMGVDAGKAMAGETVKGEHIHSSHQYGVLMMDAFAFG